MTREISLTSHAEFGKIFVLGTMPISFVGGMLLGLSVAMPFGPVSLVCVHRSINNGAAAGITSGLGAATAHGMFATLALNGSSLGASLLADWQSSLHAVAACVLVLLGARLLRRREPPSAPIRKHQLHSSFASTLLLGLSNPMTILPYLAAASTLVANASQPTLQDRMAPVMGVIFSATAWYVTISSGAVLLNMRFGRSFVRPLNSFAGCLLIVFGVLLAFR